LKLLFLLLLVVNPVFASAYRVVSDPQRQRNIPIQVSLPVNVAACSDDKQCPVVFLSSGYGVAYDKYAFISATLNKAGYLVVAIQHELPGDPPLAVTGHLFTERSENWKRGAETIRFIHNKLHAEFSAYNFNKLTLVGHSNGGDISSWLVTEGAEFVATLITLDHRRVPLPRSRSLSVLSIRGSDFPADEGVLYTEQENMLFKGCIVQINNSKHNDMTDFGPDWLKSSISNILLAFLSGQCKKPENA
jgi:pimeloyl-ACP methyl ester carboxylesterase